PIPSSAETAVRPRPAEEGSAGYPAPLRSTEEEAEFEQALIAPAAATSIKETALLEFLESPVVLNIQPDGSSTDASENASVVAWRCGTVLSILTLGLLASHHWPLVQPAVTARRRV